MTAIQSLEYRTQPLPLDPAAKKARRAYYILYLLATFIPTTILLLVLIFVPATAREFFKDFKVALPMATEWLLWISYECSRGWWLFFVPPAVLLPLIPARITARQKGISGGVLVGLLYLFCIWTVFALAAVFILVALYSPLIKLIQSISGGV